MAISASVTSHLKIYHRFSLMIQNRNALIPPENGNKMPGSLTTEESGEDLVNKNPLLHKYIRSIIIMVMLLDQLKGHTSNYFP